MNVDVSIIIVNYNTYKMTSECIDSIISHTSDINFEIIVVDNGSSDQSKECFEKDLRIKYIYSKENLGFGIANNIGAQYAQGRYLLLLNSDTLFLNNALKYFYSFAQYTSDIGGLGCILNDYNNNPGNSYGKYITIPRELKTTIYKYLEKTHLRKRKNHTVEIFEPKEVEYIIGADLFISRKLFNQFGGFDSNFFMYCEEVDLQERIHRLGLRFIIIPGPKIMHLEGASDKSNTARWTMKKYHNILISKNYYLKKRYNKLIYILFIITNSLLLIPGIIFRKDTIKNKFMIFRGALGLSHPIK